MRELPLLIEDYQSGNLPLRIALVTETYPPEINGVAMTLAHMVQIHIVQISNSSFAPPRLWDQTIDFI